jgi:hypothetical protein
MPKTEIDYSNTIIYKITCRDVVITDVYVGHTINFVQRKHAHKQSCKNMKSPNYKLKLYEVIRANGDWNNWKMEIINFFDCKDHYEARKKEQEYFISLNATLNSIEPMPRPKIIKEKEIISCNTCNIHYNSSDKLEEHNKSKKHLKKLDIQISQEITMIPNKHPSIRIGNFVCDICNIKCSKKNDWDRHILTRKHHSRVDGNQLEVNIPPKVFTCKCGKNYANYSGLWKHLKNCHISDSNTVEEETIIPHMIDSSCSDIKALTNLVLDMVKNNTEVQKQQYELQKQSNDIQKQMCEYIKENLPSKNVL